MFVTTMSGSRKSMKARRLLRVGGANEGWEAFRSVLPAAAGCGLKATGCGVVADGKSERRGAGRPRVR
jgi:hypothetical protein